MRELLSQRFPSLKWPKGDRAGKALAVLNPDAIEWQPEWYDPGVELGRAQGLEQGAAALRRTLNIFVRIRFGQSVAVLVADVVENISELDKLAEVGRWIGECDTGETLLARLRQP